MELIFYYGMVIGFFLRTAVDLGIITYQYLKKRYGWPDLIVRDVKNPEQKEHENDDG